MGLWADIRSAWRAGLHGKPEDVATHEASQAGRLAKVESQVAQVRELLATHEVDEAERRRLLMAAAGIERLIGILRADTTQQQQDAVRLHVVKE